MRLATAFVVAEPPGWPPMRLHTVAAADYNTRSGIVAVVVGAAVVAVAAADWLPLNWSPVAAADRNA